MQAPHLNNEFSYLHLNARLTALGDGVVSSLVNPSGYSASLTSPYD